MGFFLWFELRFFNRLYRWGGPCTKRRVVRGGSWNNNRDNARAAYRNWNHPDNRNNNIGFRVLRSSHTLGPPSTARSA